MLTGLTSAVHVRGVVVVLWVLDPEPDVPVVGDGEGVVVGAVLAPGDAIGDAMGDAPGDA